jgi:hypothetical protein
MKPINIITKHVFLLAAVFFTASWPARGLANRVETFANQPDVRLEQVKAAKIRAEDEREAAHQWATERGMSMRFDDGRHVIELMALRNGIPIYVSTRNDSAAISLASDQVRDAEPFLMNGTGLTMGVWDGGAVRATHQEFGGRVTVMDGASPGNHATHVGGTIGAAGVVARAKGMVPNVEIDSYEWTDDIAEMLASGAALPFESNKIHVSNHSYGTVGGWIYMPTGNSWSSRAGWHWPPWMDWASNAVDTRFGQYDAGATNYDHVVYMAPYYLPFVAAGNDRSDNPAPGASIYYYRQQGPVVGSWRSDSYSTSDHPLGDGVYKGGYDNMSAETTAKNIMTVGAVADAVSGSSRAVSNAVMLSFSSWGPADDGRIKPDIVANGYELYSAQAGSDSAYAQTNWSGTSMATPNASGSAALLVDYYNDRFPGSAMLASSLKGLIIHTADDLGNPGPDYSYGWGLMNTLAAAGLIKDYADGNALRMTEAVLHSTTNQSDSFTLFSEGIDPLRVTLCWTDPPGPEQTGHDSRTAVLVNDLDLKVIGPGGTNYPYRLDYNNPTNNASAISENNVDNVEEVYIATPVSGEYTILIDYDGSLMHSNQWYSLLVSGSSVDGDHDELPDYWELTYFGSATGAVASADSDGDGTDNLTEYIAGTIPNDPNSVFKAMTYEPPVNASNSPFIVSWDSVAGRVYSVGWNHDLQYGSFTNISGELPYPASSYTDTVDRVTPPNFYRIDVRMDN